MTSTTSRRAILAGAAALPALAAPVALGSTAPDPIFAAIERHKAAQRNYFVWLDKHFINDSDEAVEKASDAARRERDDLSMDLVNIVPTTLAGVAALLEYVDEFNRGGFSFAGMSTCVPEWPGGCLVDEETYNKWGSEPGELGFAYAVLLNVRDALRQMAVQS